MRLVEKTKTGIKFDQMLVKLNGSSPETRMACAELMRAINEYETTGDYTEVGYRLMQALDNE